jgi:hypothetical protein
MQARLIEQARATEETLFPFVGIEARVGRLADQVTLIWPRRCCTSYRGPTCLRMTQRSLLVGASAYCALRKVTMNYVWQLRTKVKSLIRNDRSANKLP